LVGDEVRDVKSMEADSVAVKQVRGDPVTDVQVPQLLVLVH